MEKYRSRVFNLLLYPNDDPIHKEAFDLIKKSYDYASIIHNNDVDDEGNVKKEHLHVVIRVRNPIWNTALAKDLGITENYIERSRNFDNSLTYLIHYNDPNKYQYSTEFVQGSLKDRMLQVINSEGKNESEKVKELIHYILEYNGIVTFTMFALYCSKEGYWDVFRRSSAIFIKIIEEHNNIFKCDDRDQVYKD